MQDPLSVGSTPKTPLFGRTRRRRRTVLRRTVALVTAALLALPHGEAFALASVAPSLPSALAEKVPSADTRTSSAIVYSHSPHARRLRLAKAHALTAAVLSRAIGLPVVGPPWRVIAPNESFPNASGAAPRGRKEVPNKALGSAPLARRGAPMALGGDVLADAGAGSARLLTAPRIGFDRHFNAVADASGDFAAPFFPSPNEAGVYSVFASHPEVVTHAVQSTFTIVGMVVQFAKFSVITAQNASLPIGRSITLFNTGAAPLKGLSFTALPGTAQGVALALDPASLPAELPAGGRTVMRFSVNTLPDASSGTLTARISEANGFFRDIVFDFSVHPAQVIPEVTPRSFSIGMLGGATVSRIITLKNLGFADWRGVSLTPPAESWVTVQGGVPSLGNILLGDIPPGGNASFALTFSPPSSLPNGVIASRPLLTVLSSNADPIPIITDVGVTSSLKGNLLLSAVNADEPRNSITGEGVPVPGAKVTITSLEVPGLSFADEGDANGLARFADIPSGNYAFRAEKPGFQTKSGVARIEPGLTTETLAVLVTAVVTYEWSVTPTTIQDKYDITLGLTFKTNVPAPAIIVDPPVIDLNINAGETAFSEYTIKNAGLVRAFNLKIRPGGNNPKLKIETPFTVIDVLEPGQSVTVPLKITAIQTSCPSDIIQMECTYSCPFGTDEVQRIESVRINAGNTCGVVSTPVTTTSGGGAGSFTIASAPTFYVSQSPAAGGTVSSCNAGPISPLSWLRNTLCGNGTDIASGNSRVSEEDAGQGQNSLGLPWEPGYNSLDPQDGLLGFGWNSQFFEKVIFDANGNMTFLDADGTELLFIKVADFSPFLSGGGSAFKKPVFTRSEVVCIGGSSSKEAVVTIREEDGTVVEYVPNLPLKEERDAAVQNNAGCGSSINPPAVPPDTQFRPAKKTDRNGNTVVHEYAPAFGPDSRLTKVTDNHGRFLQFTYDAQGRLDGMSDAAGRTTSYAYDAVGNKTSATDANGDATLYAYDAAHRLSEITYPNGGKRRYTYDAQGRVLSEEDVDTATTETGINKNSYKYFTSSTIVTDASGDTLFEYINVDGLKKISRKVEPLIGETTFLYDQDMRLIQQTDPMGRTTRFAYDASGNLTSSVNPAGRSTVANYEGKFNRATSLTDENGNRFQMVHDAKGNLLEERDPSGNSKQLSYNTQGRVTVARDALGPVAQFGYDPATGSRNSTTDPLGRTITVSLDPVSRVTSTLDPKSRTTSFVYDGRDNILRASDSGGVTEHRYIPGRRGRLLSKIIDPKRQGTEIGTSFAYDTLGRVTSITNAVGQAAAFTYDKKGNRNTNTDANGRTIFFSYDELDRLVAEILPEGERNYTYDAGGSLTKVVNYNGSSLETTYNALDRIVQTVQTLPNGFTATLGYNYDPNGNRTGMTTPWGNFAYGYDALDRLTGITLPGGGSIGFTYDARSRRTKMTLPNGIETTYAYDAAGQAEQILHRRTSDDTAVAFNNYTYDPAGNRTETRDLAGVHAFAYDDLDRLIGAQHPIESKVPQKSEVFAYDKADNRTSDGLAANYVFDDADRLLENSLAAFAYDANGNQTSRQLKPAGPGASFQYDSEDRLSAVVKPDGTSAAYKYDAFGRRIEKSTGSLLNPAITRYVYDEEHILAILNADNSLKALVVDDPVLDIPIAVKASGGYLFLHADALGSVTALTDEQANVVERVEYEAYGQAVFVDPVDATASDRSLTDNPFAFIGREHDPFIGYYRFGSRYYDPDIGRFIQADPGSAVPDYVYARNSPNVYVDRDGEIAILPLVWAGLWLWSAVDTYKAFCSGNDAALGQEVILASIGPLGKMGKAGKAAKDGARLARILKGRSTLSWLKSIGKASRTSSNPLIRELRGGLQGAKNFGTFLAKGLGAVEVTPRKSFIKEWRTIEGFFIGIRRNEHGVPRLHINGEVVGLQKGQMKLIFKEAVEIE